MAEAPTVKLAEALVAPLEAGAVLRTTKAEIIDRRKTVDDLRKLEGKVDEKTRLAAIREKTTGHTAFDAKDAKEAEKFFGLGEAVDDKGVLKPMGPDAADAKALYEAGKVALKSVTDVILYADITAESARTGKSPADLLLEKTGSSDWAKLKKDALDVLVQDETIKELFKDDDLTGLSVADRKDLLDQTIAGQSDFRDKILATYTSAEQRLKELPEVTRDEEFVKAEKAKATGDKTIDDAVAKVLTVVNGIGIADIDETWIRKAIEEGRNPETIFRQVREKAIADKTIDIDQIQAHFNPDATQKRITDINEMLLKPPKTGFNAGTEKKLSDERDKLQKILDDSAAWASQPDGKKQIKEFTEINNQINNVKDAGGVYEADFMRDLLSATTARSSIRSSEQMMQDRKKEDDKLQKSSRADRRKKESEILLQLENAVGNAVIDVLESRTESLKPMADKQAVKDKEKLETDDEKLIKKGMESNWISYDESSRRKIVDRTQIAEDMKFIIYHGEEGVKRLLASELGLIPAAANKGTFDLETLSDEQKARLTKAVEAQGGAYRDKLMTDYFLARNRALFAKRGVDIIGSVSELSLKPHEWELMQRNFGESIDGALKSSREANAIVKNLENKGIKPHFKLKYLLYALLLLGLIGAGTIAAKTI